MATRKRKYPKRPKQTSSLAVWQNYERKCKEVDKFNRQLETDKKKKKSLINKIRNRR